ncbi:MAG: sensor histidine kinase [Beijerinckiaceae bacterium]
MMTDGVDTTARKEVHAHAPALSSIFDASTSAKPPISLMRLSEVDAMGAALAHELNQPLAALSIYLQSLQKIARKMDGDQITMINELVEKALRETARTSDIVRRMRRLTLRSEPERQHVDINGIAEESIDVVMAGMSKKPAITRNFGTALPAISGDPNQIRQVLVNLLRNAVEASHDANEPHITITTSLKNGMSHIIVADNGRGLDPKVIDRLFRAFETSKPNGLGLGLAISRMIAQNHGGDLVLESEGNSAGACFALRLPLH